MSTQEAVKRPRKLIEVALPLDAINIQAAKEKGNPFLKGHPRNVHQWWARRPQGIARAVIFAQMVNDPSWKWELDNPEQVAPNNLKASWAASRKRLFSIVEDLAKWENTTNEEILEKARGEIRKSWRETCELNKDHPQAAELFGSDKLPPFYDAFAGGGALPLEAQRLGLEAYASDLNPVAVLINKAILEIPPKFAGRAPINPDARKTKALIDHPWSRAQGLAEDVRYYARAIREETQKRIGNLYPPVTITTEMAKERPDLKPLIGQRLPVIAWLWARTVKSPNPAFRHVEVPLVSTFILYGKEGKEAYVKPVVDGPRYEFTVTVGKPPADAKGGTTAGKRAAFRCLISGSPIDYDYIRTEGKAGRMGHKLMAVVAGGPAGRVYLPPVPDAAKAALNAQPAWKPETQLPDRALGFRVQEYGMTRWADLFTPRQLVALTTLSAVLTEMIEQICKDAIAAGVTDDGTKLEDGGTGALAYAQAIAAIEALVIDKHADYNNTICAWNNTNQNVGHLFTKQAIQMSWDYSETSPLYGGLAFDELADGIARAVALLPASVQAHAFMHDCAAELDDMTSPAIISTDPPYYDNVGYADLSDFFYAWLRPSLRRVFPNLFSTVAVPKAQELVATPFRHGGREAAEEFFLQGMTKAMARLSESAHPAFPVTIYYAFKQSESEGKAGTSSTGWETFLEAVLRSGLMLAGTWPMRTEREARSVGRGANALASSIVLVCRPRASDAATVSRRAFLRELNQVLPQALDEMTRGAGDEQSPVAPVDLSQAIIGPGMAVFSKYAAVLEADGTPMTVRTALQVINRFLAEDDFDHDTQFCLHWFEQHGWKEGKFGEADTLARAKGTSVDGVKQAGVLSAGGGVVRLLKWSEYPTDWDPTVDTRLPIWEVLHQVIRVFKTTGESGAGALLAAIQAKAEATRQLAYRLYTLCERAGWAEDARAYNEIVTSWGAIEAAAAAAPTPKQSTLFT